MPEEDPYDYPGRYVKMPGPCGCTNINHYITLDWGPNPTLPMRLPLTKSQEELDIIAEKRAAALRESCVPAKVPRLASPPRQPQQPDAGAPSTSQLLQSHSGLQAGANATTTPVKLKVAEVLSASTRVVAQEKAQLAAESKLAFSPPPVRAKMTPAEVRSMSARVDAQKAQLAASSKLMMSPPPVRAKITLAEVLAMSAQVDAQKAQLAVKSKLAMSQSPMHAKMARVAATEARLATTKPLRDGGDPGQYHRHQPSTLADARFAAALDKRHRARLLIKSQTISLPRNTQKD